MTDENTFYNYDADTGEHLGQGQKNPRLATGPANSTPKKPPIAPAGKVSAFDGNEWNIFEDHRGRSYWLDYYTEKVMVELGPLPDGATWDRPDEPHEEKQERLRRKVNEERAYRVHAGLEFEGHFFQFDPASRQNIAEASSRAKFSLLIGGDAESLRWAEPSADFAWTTADNAQIKMSASKMADLGEAAAKWVLDHHTAATALKNMKLIPDDCNADKFWP